MWTAKQTTIHISNSVPRQVQQGLREQSEVLVACLLLVRCAAILVCAATRACPSGRVHGVALIDPLAVNINGIGEPRDASVKLGSTTVTQDRAQRVLHIHLART